MKTAFKAVRAQSSFSIGGALFFIAATALVISLLVPMVTRTTAHGPYRRARSHAGGIYKMLFAAQTEMVGQGGLSVFPVKNGKDFESSTEYFRWLLTAETEGGAEVLSRDFSMFVIWPNKPAGDLEAFDADTNDWSVVTEVSETTKAGTPFLISANLNEQYLRDWEGFEELTLAYVNKGAHVLPHEDDAVVVSRSGGGGYVLMGDEMRWSVLNPHRDIQRILVP